jgi:hypothetical protein
MWCDLGEPAQSRVTGNFAPNRLIIANQRTRKEVAARASRLKKGVTRIGVTRVAGKINAVGETLHWDYEAFQRRQPGEGTRYERETLRLMMVTDETRLSRDVDRSIHWSCPRFNAQREDYQNHTLTLASLAPGRPGRNCQF